MPQVKLIRLKDGEDILCTYDVKDGHAELEDPLLVLFRRDAEGSGMIFMPWLPVELIDSNIAVIDVNQVMTVMTPKQSLVSYYHTQIDKIKRRLEEDDNFFDDSVGEEPTQDQLNGIDLEDIKAAIKRTLH